MADELDEGSGSVEGAGTLAAQIALDEERHHSAEAREYLRKQSRIADLQIDTLQKKDEFELSHLRFRRFSDYARFALEIAAALIVLLIVCGLATMVWSAARDRDIVFDAFSVPADVAQSGMTGAVLANRVLDRFETMQQVQGVTQVAATGRRDEGDQTRVEIPDTGISLGELARYLRAWLGHEVHVTGDLVHTGSDFALTVRYGSQPGVTLKQPAGELDKLVQKSAEHIFSAARPYRFADYLVHEQRYAEAEAIVPPLAERGSAEDRALAYSAWAEIEFYRGNMHAALEKGAEAVRLNPQNPLTHLWLGATEGNVGHEEASWSGVSEGVRLLDNGAADTVDPFVIALSPEFRAYAAENVGDFNQAIRHYTESRGSDLWRTNLGNEIDDLSAAHDLKAAHALVRSIPATRSRDGKPNADRSLAPFYIAFNASDWPAAVRAASAADAVFAGLPDSQSGRRINLWPQWAYAMAMNGDMSGAEHVIAKTTADCDLCMRMRGRIAALKRDWVGAERDFAVVAARSPHIPFAEADWGQMLLAKGDFDGAIAKFEAAHKIGPHFADPLEMCGEALIAKNRSDLALAKFEDAAKYAPNWGRLHLKWGEALLWSGDKAGAQKQFTTAAHLDLTPSERIELARLGAPHVRRS